MPATKSQLRRRLFVILRAFAPFLFALVRSKLPFGDREGAERRAAARLREALERLGIVFIKVGQVVGVRTDTLSPAYCDELAKLQHSVMPVPIHVVKPYLEREYGRVLSEIFESFDPQPLATASLGQVHRARWRGEELVVKFLKPDTAEVLDTDFQLIEWGANILKRFSKTDVWEDLVSVLGRFEKGFREETDFSIERLHGDRIRRILLPYDDIIVPEMVPQLCTKHVVAMEFIQGTRISDAGKIRRLGVNPTRMLNRLVEMYAHMILFEGYYHADPHPGNFLVLDDGRLALLDFGMVQTVSDKTRSALYDTLRAALSGNTDRVVDGFYQVGLIPADTPRDKAKAAIQKIGEVNFAQSVTSNRIQAVGKAVEQSKVRFTMPEDLAYAFRLIQMLEGVASYYQPGWNIIANGGTGLQAAIEEFARARPPVTEEKVRTNGQPPPRERRPAPEHPPGESPARRFFSVLRETLLPIADRIDQIREESAAAEAGETEPEAEETPASE